MRGIARRMLRARKMPQVQYEADDAVDSSFGCIIAAVMKGQFRWVPDAEGFWALFRKILTAKIGAEIRRQQAWKRGGPRRGPHTANPGDPDANASGAWATHRSIEFADNFDFYAANLYPVDTVAIANEMIDRLLGVLTPEQESVARLKLAGNSISRIAEVLELSRRTVDARWQAARNVWNDCRFSDEYEFA
jgi:DNA-directed RNA polymerase specialized sigma24 family protein